MKRFLPSVAFFALSFLGGSMVHAQMPLGPRSISPSQLSSSEQTTHSFGQSFNEAIKGNSLPEAISIPGADLMPVSGRLEQQQSDGRALHNIQVDPSNPMNVHAVIMELASDWVKDTNFLSRRVFYTFSSDGGHTWKTPVALTNVKTGFPCMILYKRGEKYVPIIAAHRFMLPLAHDTSTTDYECALWVEKGNPGDGNFEMTECGTSGTYGSIPQGAAGILWPYIGISPDGSTVYMVGSVSYSSVTQSDYIRFGTFALDGTGHATWNGWNAEIGSNNGNHGGAGLMQSGDYVLRVSPAGKVGLLWRSTDYTTPEADLYFLESTDGGKTWPNDFEPIQPIVDQGSTAAGSELFTGPWTGIDFYYYGENARVLYNSVPQTFSNDTNYYYPDQLSLHVYDVTSNTDVDIVTNAANDTAANNLNGTLTSFEKPELKENDDWIAYPVFAPNGDAKAFAVFYQTFPISDSVFVTDTTYKFYASIFYQSTRDGGLTWTQPAPYRTNTGDPNTFGKIDFRWPQASDWNGNSPADFVPTLMYGADTAAGTTASNGAPDWDVVNFFHDTLALQFSGVSPSAVPVVTSISNYPNPVASSSAIDFTLPQASNVTLTVTDQLGRTVATIMNGRLGAGEHTAVFNAAQLPNGVYRYTLQTEEGSISKSMSLLR